MRIADFVGVAALACLALTCGPTVEGADWPTFHGAPSLNGVADSGLAEGLAERWRLKVGKSVDWAPVLGNETIYVDDGAGSIVAIGFDGKRRWSTKLVPAGTNAVDTISAPMVYADGIVAAAGDSGVVYGVNATNGTVSWQFEAGETIQGALNVTPHGPGGKTLVLAMLQPVGRVVALDVRDGVQWWISEETARCDGHLATEGEQIAFGSCNAGFHIMSTLTGKQNAFIEVGEGCEMAGGVALSDGDVFSGNRSGSFAAARASERRVLWINEDGDGEMFTTPAVSPDHVVFSSGACVVLCLSRADGSVQWKYETGAFEPVSPIIAGDSVVAVAEGAVVQLSMETGEKIWSRDIGGQLREPAVVDRQLVVASDDGYVVFFADAPGPE